MIVVEKIEKMKMPKMMFLGFEKKFDPPPSRKKIAFKQLVSYFLVLFLIILFSRLETFCEI